MLARRSEILVSVVLAIAVITTTVAHGSMPRKCCCQKKSSQPATCCQRVKVPSQNVGCPHCQLRSQSNEGQGPCLIEDTTCRCGCKTLPKPIPAVRIVIPLVVELDFATSHTPVHSTACTGRDLSFRQSTYVPDNGPPLQALLCTWRI